VVDIFIADGIEDGFKGCVRFFDGSDGEGVLIRIYFRVDKFFGVDETSIESVVKGFDIKE
jgi:hypothetical protein